MSDTTIELIDGKPTIVKSLPNGRVASFQKTIQLTPGEHWFLQPVQSPQSAEWVNRKSLTARAYDMLKSILGISVVCPDTLVNQDGVTVGNPYIIRKSGLVETVQYRVIAVGRGPAGNLSAVDLTFVYSQQAYMTYDLYLRWAGLAFTRNAEPQPKEWGQLIPSDLAALPTDVAWVSFPIALPGMCLSVDINHRDVIPLWRDYQEAQKFAERNAHSMAVRNAIRKLTGITYADENGCVTVTIWPQADISLEALNGIVVGSGVINGEVVTVEKTIDSVDTEGLDAVKDVDEVSAVDSSHEENSVVPLPETKDDVIIKIRERINSLPGKHKSDIAISCARGLGYDTPADLRSKADLEVLKTYLERISRS